MYYVTGIDGFIASNILKKIDTAVAWDLSTTDLFHILDSYKTPHALFHLGAVSSTTEQDTEKLSRLNILSSCKLLEWCIKRDIPFVYASSASVYGLGNNGFNEDSDMSPINYYAISKASFDMFALQKMKDHPNAKIFGLRYFNVYGPNEGHKDNMASPVYKFIKQASEVGKIEVFEGSEKYVRDFISVEDVVDVTISAKDFKTSGIYNVGTGIPRSFMDVANIVSDHTGAKIIEIPFPNHLVGKYQTYTKANTNKLINEYNHHFYTLEEGISRCVDKMVNCE